MEEVLITVVVPVYKVEKYLKKCIDSIIKQTYKNLDIILVDDGSPDKCGKICDNYSKKDSRITVIHKENGGLSDARNVGIKKAKGDYITFIDSDDYIDNNYVETLYKYIKIDNADLCIGSHRVIYPNGTIIDKSTNKFFSSNSELILEKILYDDGVDLSAWGKLYKTRLFRDIEFPVGRLFEDAATTYKLVDKANKIYVCSIPLYNYIIRDDSITNKSFSTKKIDLIISTNEMTDFIRNKYKKLDKACDRRLLYSYFSTLTQLIKCDTSNKKIEKELIKYINSNKLKVLFDYKAPKRDKMAILALSFGVSFYKKMWSIYKKIKRI